MTRRKRGISTIVGAVFFMLVVIAALTMMSSASQQQGNFSTTATEVGRLQLERMVSALEITDVRFVNDPFGVTRFNITMQNNGPLTEKVVRFWVTNETSSWHDKYDVSYLIGPKQTLTVGQELPLVAKDTQSYTIKAVTERGSIVSFKTVSIFEANLKLTLSIIPPNIVIGENVTIILSVTNDQKDVQAVHKINPILSNSTLNCGGANQPACPTVKQKGPSPSPVESLLRGSTATFKWVYNMGGAANTAGAIVRFTATLAANSISDDLRITQITIGQTNFASHSGTLTITYESLKWLRDTCTVPIDESDWNSGWRITNQANGWTTFRINVTNHSPDNDITLDKRSVFFLQSVDGNANKIQFFIVNATQALCDQNAVPIVYDYDAYLQTGLNKVMVFKNNTKVIYFGATNAGGTASQKLNPVGVYGGSFVIFGRMGSVMYGQNIPFIGIEVVP